jgi:hypothetical protein
MTSYREWNAVEESPFPEFFSGTESRLIGDFDSVFPVAWIARQRAMIPNSPLPVHRFRHRWAPHIRRRNPL